MWPPIEKGNTLPSPIPNLIPTTHQGRTTAITYYTRKRSMNYRIREGINRYEILTVDREWLGPPLEMWHNWWVDRSWCKLEWGLSQSSEWGKKRWNEKIEESTRFDEKKRKVGRGEGRSFLLLSLSLPLFPLFLSLSFHWSTTLRLCEMMLIGMDAIESPDYFNLFDRLDDGRKEKRERRRKNSTVTMHICRHFLMMNGLFSNIAFGWTIRVAKWDRERWSSRGKKEIIGSESERKREMSKVFVRLSTVVDWSWREYWNRWIDRTSIIRCDSFEIQSFSNVQKSGVSQCF